MRAGAPADICGARGEAGAPYEPGLLALREGPLLERAVRGLAVLPEVLLVNASGRDHPRRAGLALHLGAVLDVPTIGVTHRPLVATGRRPLALQRGAAAPVVIGDEIVGKWVRTRLGVAPLVAHAAWRTDPDTAAWLLLETSGNARTPAPLREARRLARTARSLDTHRNERHSR
jgi:deoxyribonuclease V